MPICFHITAYHEEIKISLCELVFERKPQLSFYTRKITTENHSQGISSKFNQQANYLRKNAKENLIKTKKLTKKHYDKRVKLSVLENTYVLLNRSEKVAKN